MATINEMRQVATQIETETQVGGNTASRVGGLFNDVVDKLENVDGITPMDEIPTSGSAKAVKSGGVYDAIKNIEDKFYKKTSIKSGYLSTMGGYCKSSTIASSTVHHLYLYQLTAGVRYKFTKIAQAETAQRLVFTIADSSQFAVGGSVASIIVRGSSANGDYYYTPQEDTYVVVELNRTSPSTIYISEVSQLEEMDLSQFEPKADYDNTPTNGSDNAVKSGGIYNALQLIDEKIDQRTQIVNTRNATDIGLTGNYYYYTHNKTIGSSAPTLTSTTSDTYAAKFNAKKGFTYKVYSRSTSSSDYGRPVIVAVNGIIVAMATSNNVMTTPFTYVAEEDAIIYVNCAGTYISDFSVVETTPLADYVQEIEVEKVFPVVYMPKKLYGVVGDTMQIFYRGIVRKWNPYGIFLQVMASGFKSTPRYTQTTPSSVGTTTINCRLIDDDYDMSQVVTSTLYRKSVPSSAPTLNVLCMGASTVVNAGCFPVELKRRLCDTGGTPAGLGFSSIQFVGRKTVKSSSVHCEATGGWTWAKFVSAGEQEIRFYLTNADTGYIGAIYSFVSSLGTVQIQLEEWNVTQGEGNALFSYVSSSNAGKVPTSQSGTLTYVSGADEPAPNLSFTDYEVEAANPFWNPSTNSLDIQMYADQYCGGTIDVLICSLNPFNSGIVGNADIATVVNQMKTFINAYHADFPNGKVIIDSSYPPSAYYGVEYNYGGTNVRTSWSVLFGRFKWAAACDEVCNDSNYSSFVYYANTFGEVDTENAFPTTERAVDTRITDKTEPIGTNGVHPTTTGCKMEADAIYRCFVCNILN